MDNQEMQRRIMEMEREIQTLKEAFSRTRVQQISFPLDTQSLETIAQALKDNGYSI